MNLNLPNTEDELRALLTRADDQAGDHILWVETEGSVHLTKVPHSSEAGRYPLGTNVRLRYAPFYRGEEMVGPNAAAEPELVSDLYYSLQHHWMLALGAAPGELEADLDDPESGQGWSLTNVTTVDDALLQKLMGQELG